MSNESQLKESHENMKESCLMDLLLASTAKDLPFYSFIHLPFRVFLAIKSDVFDLDLSLGRSILLFAFKSLCHLGFISLGL